MSAHARKTPVRRLGAGLAAATLSTAGLWSFAPQASAHDVVVESHPADGAVVEEFPESIVLEFSGEPREGFNTIAVTDSNGEIVFEGEPELDGRILTVDVPDDVDAADGSYSVGYQITSSDGHATRGGLEFSVGDADSASSGDTDTAAQDSSKGSTDAADDADSEMSDDASADEGGARVVANVLIAVGAIAAAIAVIVLLVQKRKRFDDK